MTDLEARKFVTYEQIFDEMLPTVAVYEQPAPLRSVNYLCMVAVVFLCFSLGLGIIILYS